MGAVFSCLYPRKNETQEVGHLGQVSCKHFAIAESSLMRYMTVSTYRTLQYG